MKVLAKIAAILFISTYLVGVLGFTGKHYEAVLCRGMNVVVRDSLERSLITAADVENLIRLEQDEIAGKPITTVDAAGIEENLNRFPSIAGAQVYTNIGGWLMVEITQRCPVARIEDRDHECYYLDRDGYIIPANPDYTPHILCVNGEIPGSCRKLGKISPVREAGQEKAGKEISLMQDILALAGFIGSDPFWTSQIVQVYVNGKGEFELVPRVGSHIILLGSAERMETKFFKLKTLYREGFKYTGWNQYEIINLKYKNQVICTKR